MAQFCPIITQRGNFLSDPYFLGARATLEHMALEMQQSTNKQLMWPPPNVNYLLSELCAWQQSSQNLNNAMASTLSQDVLSTVFRFENDHFKVIILIHNFFNFDDLLWITPIQKKLSARKINRGDMCTISSVYLVTQY